MVRDDGKTPRRHKTHHKIELYLEFNDKFAQLGERERTMKPDRRMNIVSMSFCGSSPRSSRAAASSSSSADIVNKSLQIQ